MDQPDINTAQQLKNYIEAIENLEAEKKEVGEKIKEIYSGAKSAGFDTKIIKLLIKQRKMDKAELEEQEYLLETYKEALGMGNKPE